LLREIPFAFFCPFAYPLDWRRLAELLLFCGQSFALSPPFPPVSPPQPTPPMQPNPNPLAIIPSLLRPFDLVRPPFWLLPFPLIFHDFGPSILPQFSHGVAFPPPPFPCPFSGPCFSECPQPRSTFRNPLVLVIPIERHLSFPSLKPPPHGGTVCLPLHKTL